MSDQDRSRDRPEISREIEMFLVIPRSTLDRNQGGGQRTATIFEALLDLAPTTVVVLGRLPFDDVETHFPGAKAVLVWPDIDLSEESFGVMSKGASFFRKYFRPYRFYAANPLLRKRLGDLVSGVEEAVIVFRLFPPFAAADTMTRADKGLFVFVDVDDRDDQKSETRLRTLFGDRVVDTVLRQVCIDPVRRLFAERLHGVSEAWFASAEDAAVPGVTSRVIENAAFTITEATAMLPPSASRDMIFVGPAFFPPNRHGMRWFIDQCWPELSRQCPETRLKIVGAGDWERCVAQAACRERIDVLGFVDDLAAEYATSRLALCPLNEGGGSKVKLIEACAFGRPVVATAHATRGFSTQLTDTILKADAASGFVAACRQLRERPDEADRRGQLLRDVQVRLYSRNVVKSKIIDSITRLGPGGSGSDDGGRQ